MDGPASRSLSSSRNPSMITSCVDSSIMRDEAYGIEAARLLRDALSERVGDGDGKEMAERINLALRDVYTSTLVQPRSTRCHRAVECWIATSSYPTPSLVLHTACTHVYDEPPAHPIHLPIPHLLSLYYNLHIHPLISSLSLVLPILPPFPTSPLSLISPP